MIHDYKKLIVWERSIELVVEIYSLTRKFPKEELYGLTSQMRRAAVSIASNIAEGCMRGGGKEFRHFLLTAFSSGAELETQLVIVKRVYSDFAGDSRRSEQLLTEVMKMLNKMISSVVKKSSH